LKKQVEWMAGRYAAKHLARRFSDGRPHPASTRVAYRSEGAPYLAQAPSVPLSISHSWDYAVAGLGFDPACRLGLDLERIRPASRATLLRTAFSDREAAALRSADDTALFLRWTAKEAYLKAVGMGFHESLKQVEILDDAIWHRRRPVPALILRSHLPFQGYAFSLVCRRL
jgi:4'-phosphopantetheinyl transferase